MQRRRAVQASICVWMSRRTFLLLHLRHAQLTQNLLDLGILAIHPASRFGGAGVRADPVVFPEFLSSTISASGVKSAWLYGVKPVMWALSVAPFMMRNTWPSPGLACNWFSAIVPLPPGRLTMRIGASTKRCACTMRCISRAVRSLVPAAAFGTMKVIGRVGFHAS